MNKKDPTYTEEQIQEKLKAFPGWWYEDGWIRRNYKTDGWPTTLMLVSAIGYLAEAAYHHPDLAVTWGCVIVKLKNHAAGGVTDKDFELARKIEEVVLWRRAARAKGRPTSSCAPAIRGERRATPRGRAPTGAVRHGEARRAGPPPHPRRDGAAVRLRRSRHAHHGGGPHDDAMDRPLPRGPTRHRPRADPRPVRGRPRGHRREGAHPR